MLSRPGTRRFGAAMGPVYGETNKQLAQQVGARLLSEGTWLSANSLNSDL